MCLWKKKLLKKENQVQHVFPENMSTNPLSTEEMGSMKTVDRWQQKSQRHVLYLKIGSNKKKLKHLDD